MDISTKNTKNEILDAYNTLLSQINDTKQVSFQVAKKQQDEEIVVTKATDFTSAKIVHNIAQVKISIEQSLDTLEQQLVGEYKRLHELQTAIALETNHLEEVHQIRKNADSLAALLLAHKELTQKFEAEFMQKKQELEEDVAFKKTAWKKEQEEFEANVKERDMQMTKERLREAEEYSYAVTLERKKDDDDYQYRKETLEKDLLIRKATAEKEFAHKELMLAQQEEDNKQLRIKVELFDKELEKSIHDTEKKTREVVELFYKHQIDLASKDVDGERKLNQQTIVTLQAKIKDQELVIKQLNQRADDAQIQVQSIAIKALEGVTGTRQISLYEKDKHNERI